MEINWTRIKETLHNLDAHSGASTDYARGCLVSVAACITALGFEWSALWHKLIPLLPDGFRVYTIPSVWVAGNKEGWKIPFDKFPTFADLIAEIPKEMRTTVVQDDWTCRDVLLDKYLYVLGIMQRETEAAHNRWKEDMWKAAEPKLGYFFHNWRHAGSQYIAEWGVNDLNKERAERFNFHGQNTSQWLYAGALCVQDGRVSIHT